MKITEVTNNNMFWGVTLEGGKRYAQTVQTSFHISMAALEPQHGKTGKTSQSADQDGKHTSVMINHDKAEFLLCTLTHGRLYQQPLDLNFTEGEEVTFFLNGPGIVHLTGYLAPEEPLEDETELSDDDSDISYVEEDSSEDDSSEEEDSSEDSDSDEEVPKLKPIKFNMDSSPESTPGKSATKRKKAQAKDSKRKKKKRLVLEEESEDEEESVIEEESEDEEESVLEEESEDSDEMEVEEEDEDDSDWETEDSNFIDDEAEEADSDEEEESEEDEHMVASSGSFLQPQKSKIKQQMEKLKADKQKESPKKDKQKESPKKGKSVNVEPESPKTNGEEPTANGTTETKKKKKKKKKNKQKDKDADEASSPTSPAQANMSNNNSSSPTKAAKGKKRTLKGGVNMEEFKEGHGPEAVQGKTVAVYYTGKLENGKQFDSCTSGKPFKFKLGKGEVIKGWDTGVTGMKVGGKRKLVIPPAQGYGNEKMGSIPRNSTLHFEIELKAVS